MQPICYGKATQPLDRTQKLQMLTVSSLGSKKATTQPNIFGSFRSVVHPRYSLFCEKQLLWQRHQWELHLHILMSTAVHCVKQFYPRNNGGKSSIVAVFIILMAVTTGHYSWSSQNYKLCWSVPSKLINHGLLPKSWSMPHKMLSQKGTLAVML